MMAFLLGLFLGATAGFCIMGLLLNGKLADLEAKTRWFERILEGEEVAQTIERLIHE